MKPWSQDEVMKYLNDHLQKWTFSSNSIQRDFKFQNFVQAFAFMTSVALEAEKVDHHPDWSNSYNQVHISLKTHFAGGITEKDYYLASKIDLLYRVYE